MIAISSKANISRSGLVFGGFTASVLLLLAACGGNEAPPPPSEDTFMADQAAALEKAKAVEDELQKAKEQLDRTMAEQQ